jgi:hypothetical protein
MKTQTREPLREVLRYKHDSFKAGQADVYQARFSLHQALKMQELLGH